ncbi:hypothetical protein NECHADRAFT_56763 [Paecilomyces variotii No. 5]|uniref:Short-chain dehydrogenase n=1 Tax=Byssochlamys spectabilis (strain No. 5 / NBRC 109023) TaxID=1356009 RepID=V5FWA2_BYSSN|nr:hypothetical protein NECHADRAFT_56763 [Paecilomyces variotii No. 5]
MGLIGIFMDQSYPPKPTFTERELPDLTGKVMIVTGGYSGVGYQLTKLIYAKNATVYIAGRRPTEGNRAIQEISAAYPSSKGKLEFLFLDLSDLWSIKESASDFQAKESRLDVLWNNAGVMGLPTRQKTKQGYDALLGTNCLGPYLFTKLLHPLMVKTAQSSVSGSVRVLWAASIVVHMQCPKTGMDLDNLDYRKKNETAAVRYAISKAGNLFIGSEWAKRDACNGVVHLIFNPGNLQTSLQRNMGCLERHFYNAIMHDAIYGAYTELWAGLSPTVRPSDSGRYVIPWGRFGPIRSDIAESMKGMEEGGNGKAAAFLDYCDQQTKIYQ